MSRSVMSQSAGSQGVFKRKTQAPLHRCNGTQHIMSIGLRDWVYG